jgi:hypothetical protein
MIAVDSGGAQSNASPYLSRSATKRRGSGRISRRCRSIAAGNGLFIRRELAGNCDAAVDIWPVIQSSTASVFSGERSSLGLARLRHAAADLGRRSAIAGTAGARSGGSAAAAVLGLWAL